MQITNENGFENLYKELWPKQISYNRRTGIICKLNQKSTLPFFVRLLKLTQINGEAGRVVQASV